MRRLLHLSVLSSMVLLALVAAGGCAPNPNAPTSVTGTWIGTVASSVLGATAEQLTLTQSGASITGFFTFTVPGQTTSGSGTVTGALQGSSITLTLPTGSCIRTWSGMLSGRTMSGTFAAAGTCANLDSGTFTLTLE